MHISNVSASDNLCHPAFPSTAELICFSHLRWDFVFQRPQHLLSRFARTMKVWYIEEPVYTEDTHPRYVPQIRAGGIKVLVPYLPKGLDQVDDLRLQKELFDDFMGGKSLTEVTFWYYTPMALPFTRHFTPAITVYDCMDELSSFKFAPAALKSLEKELLKKADIVFTGGYSLYEAKKDHHVNIHAFPSSIDKKHFSAARSIKDTEPFKSPNAKLKLGFYGVIDERFDVGLIAELAQLRPDWEIILVGPVVKIDPAILPRHSNIKYLGSKSYDELPAQMADWDIALIPFLLNESTRFISPTKTPEYLAAGISVISTPIKDVVNPYSHKNLISIGSDANDFVAKAAYELSRERQIWLQEVDQFLAGNSWDLTALKMQKIMFNALNGTSLPIENLKQNYV